MLFKDKSQKTGMRDKQGLGIIHLFIYIFSCIDFFPQVGFQPALKAVYLSQELAYN
jgi:hypothetical protein